MSEWRECKLGEVIEIKYGKDHKHLQLGKIPTYGSGGIMRHVDNSIYNKVSILIPRKGTLTNMYFVDVPFWAVDTIFWTKIDNTVVYPKYLFYQLKIVDFETLNVGSAVPSLNIPVINDVDIIIPPLPEQKAIAEILSSLDDKIDLLNRQNKTLEALAETYFRQWFIEKADEEWEKKSLHKVLNIMGGGTPKTSVADYWNGTIPWFTPKDAKGIFCVQTEKYITNKGLVNCNSRLFDIGTIFVSARGTVGKVAIAGVPMAMNQSCYALCGEGKLSNWIVYLLLKESIREIQVNASGAVFDAIVTDTFKAISLSLPDLTDEIFSKFDSLVEPLFRKVQSNTSQIQTLQMLGDTLLPKLISGEVRVEMRGVQ